MGAGIWTHPYVQQTPYQLSHIPSSWVGRILWILPSVWTGVFQALSLLEMKLSVTVNWGWCVSGYSVLDTVLNVRGSKEEVTILCMKAFKINIQERLANFPWTNCLSRNPSVDPGVACPLPWVCVLWILWWPNWILRFHFLASVCRTL